MFLSHHIDPYSTVNTPGKTEWETEREREEFARAAKLYKPLAGMMAMRFTTGTQQEDDTKVDVKVEEKVCLHDLSRLMTKATKWHVRPAKNQISLGIHPV